MAQFPLLSLPSVALEEVLKLLDPFELFDLSQCSRKSVASVRLAGTKQYKLSLESKRVVVNEKYKFEADVYGEREKRSPFLTNGRLLLTNGIFIDVGYYRGYWDKCSFYFGDRNLGLPVILFHLVEIFGCRIDSIETGFDFPDKIQRSIIGQVIKKQKDIRRLVIDLNLNENDLRRIMDNLTITDYCECYVMTSPDFEYVFKTYPRFLLIRCSHWFKLDDLIAAAKSCVVIRLLESYLENKDIDVFMKSWTSGDFPTLRYLEIESRHLNRRDQIYGQDPDQWRSNREDVVRGFIEIDGKSYRMNNGVEIQKDDGIKAEVEMKLERYQKYFRLYVM